MNETAGAQCAVSPGPHGGDASRESGGYSYPRLLRRVEERAPGLAPFRRRLIAMPLGLDHPVWIDDPDLDVRRHVHQVRASAIALGFGAAVAHLRKIAIAKRR